MKKTLFSALKKLMRSFGLFLYEWPRAENTSTIVVFFDNGTSVLAIRRAHEPFQGKRAFAGGFLDPEKETLRQCARRELREETRLVFAEDRFIPVDERSSPTRDPRGHVCDHGYMVIVPDSEKQDVIANMHHDDDAASVEVVPVAQLLAEGMAFDHEELLRNALTRAGYPIPA